MERPSSPGSPPRRSSPGHGPPGRPCGSTRSTGSPAVNCAVHRGDAGRQQGLAPVRRPPGQRPGQGAAGPGARWRAPARTAGRPAARAPGGRTCPPARRPAPRRRARRRGEHHRDARAGGDPGRLDFGHHAAGAHAGPAGRADADPGQVLLAADLLDPARRRAGSGRRCRERPHRRAGPAGRRRPARRPGRRAGRCRRTGSPRWPPCRSRSRSVPCPGRAAGAGSGTRCGSARAGSRRPR